MAESNNESSIPPALKLCLSSLNRIIYYVTEEEDEAINEIKEHLANSAKKANWTAKIYNAAYGLVPLEQYHADLGNRSLTKNADSLSPVAAMEAIYKDASMDKKVFYLITDPEVYLRDPSFVRRVLNIHHQVRQEETLVKVLIFISNQLVTPNKLAPFMHVIRGPKPSPAKISQRLLELGERTKTQIPTSAPDWCKGMTMAEVESAYNQSVTTARHDPDESKRKILSKAAILNYKRDRIKKTEVVSHVDVSGFTFDKVGGLDKFKEWAQMVKSSWTAEGRKFGLRPPKGVLNVGIWGCGKSLSVKALGSTWGVPVISLELGKLRSSGVGETEANMYRAISVIEAMAPCIVWIDEAEKTFAGSTSNGNNDAGTAARTLGILSTWHQETDSEVCLALTANSLSNLPAEIVNRIEDRFFFDLPTEEDRVEILKIQLPAQGNLTKEDLLQFNLVDLAKASEGMVPREMEQGIRQALRASFYADKASLDFNILTQEFLDRPRLLKTMETEVKELKDWVGYDADRDEGVRARMATSRKRKKVSIVSGGSSQ